MYDSTRLLLLLTARRRR